MSRGLSFRVPLVSPPFASGSSRAARADGPTARGEKLVQGGWGTIDLTSAKAAR